MHNRTMKRAMRWSSTLDYLFVILFFLTKSNYFVMQFYDSEKTFKHTQFTHRILYAKKRREKNPNVRIAINQM